MRDVTDQYDNVAELSTVADAATDAMESSMDGRSGYHVGAAVRAHIEGGLSHDEKSSGTEEYLYTGTNINFSGIQTKVHAEQMALRQLLLDMQQFSDKSDVRINDVVVRTSEDDMALVCGHCIQVFVGACEEFGFNPTSIRYIACSACEHPKSKYKYEKKMLADLMAPSYVELD